MDPLLFQTILPFSLSALIVIFITVGAEKFGTKVGGILGTMPSTIIIAFVFIAYNQGVNFASKAVAVVPAELGVNILFLFVFALLATYSGIIALLAAFGVWAVSSSILYLVEFDNIYLSLIIYACILVSTFLILEHKRKIPSQERVPVQYTVKKIIFRGVLAGIIISISVLLSNINAVLSGIFSVFPAILSSTMIIQLREQGPSFAAGMAKSMSVGITSVATYATLIHFLYPLYGIMIGSVVAFGISFCVTMVLFSLRNKLR